MTRSIVFLAAFVAGLLKAADGQEANGAQDYRIFRGDGAPATIEQITAEAKTRDVLLLGEVHDDTVAHRLELQLLTSLLDPKLVLSLEMFERDVQGVVDEYLTDLITEEHLLASGRAWKNYKSDYRPLVELAKKSRIPVVAANAPRRYVNRVTRLGQQSLEILSNDARSTLPPLPYAKASTVYADKFHKLMEEIRRQNPEAPERNPKFQLEAQSLWDASMAESIAKTLERNGSARVLHVNGSFHSEQRTGILDHLKIYRPNATALVVTMRPHKSFPAWDADKLSGLGDFVIVTKPSSSK